MRLLDASAAADLLLGTPPARGVADELESVAEAHVPEVLEPEVLAVLRRWRARTWIAPEVADRAAAELGELAIVRHGHGPLRPRVWALRDRCSPYDGCYVALAELLGARLVTTDRRLARAATGLVETAVVS